MDEVVIAPGGAVGRTSSGKVQRALTRAKYERGEFDRRSADSGSGPITPQ
jgi:acyl-CoA synthetase (AMP-forming)/AMP-acid ligase II